VHIHTLHNNIWKFAAHRDTIDVNNRVNYLRPKCLIRALFMV